MNAPNIDLTSIGQIAGEIQMPVAILQKIIVQLNISPVQRLNGVPYFDVADVARIAQESVAFRQSGPVGDRTSIQ